MVKQTKMVRPHPLHVSLIAIPDAVVSTLTGIYDVMNAPALTRLMSPGTPAPFRVEIVGERPGFLQLASGIPVGVQRTLSSIDSTDLIIVPSILLADCGWRKGRYPVVVEWLQRMHMHGALLCSACSGLFLLAETALFDSWNATVHFVYADAFSTLYPRTTIHPERALVVSGQREELVSSGASTSWHDLVLYLTARFAGATIAQEIARLFAMQWHQDGLAPFIVFEGRRDHGDGEIASAQEWLAKHFAMAHPVEEVMRRTRLAERTFKRRFTSATGIAPMAYVQRLRIEDAKRRLERTDDSTEKISWRVGYEDPAFFRRLFKRATGMAPGAYRKRFRLPDFARS